MTLQEQLNQDGERYQAIRCGILPILSWNSSLVWVTRQEEEDESTHVVQYILTQNTMKPFFIEGFFVLSNRWQIAVSSALRSWCRPRLAMREVRTETLHHSVTTHGQRCCRFVCFPNQRFSLVTQWNILFFLPSVNPTTKRGTFCLTARQWTLAVWRLHRQQSKRRPRRPPMVCRVCRCKMLQVCQISTLYCPP